MPAFSESFERIQVTADEGLFIGAGPALELGFTALCRSNVRCRFGVQNPPTRIMSGGGATTSTSVFILLPFKVGRPTHGERSRLQAKNVVPGWQRRTLRHTPIVVLLRQTEICDLLHDDVGPRFRATHPSHGQSPFRRCASLQSLWSFHGRTFTSKAYVTLGEQQLPVTQMRDRFCLTQTN